MTDTAATEASASPLPYDAILVLSFGGPEGMDDIMPFLENVLRGRNVPRERMLSVAHHYELFDGISPINQQNRDLIAALRQSLDAHGIGLPIYWGNRNWHPLLPDTLREMARDGRRHALTYITSAYSSYSGCRQYLEDIERAQAEIGPDAPRVSTLRKFYNHPDFIRANADRVRDALATIAEPRRSSAMVVFTAHSIPQGMAQSSRYVSQLRETARLVAEDVGISRWELVYQSRSGPPTQPWLEPDICETLRELHDKGDDTVVVAPIGFLSDHVEVLYDLDVEARQLADELGMTMARAQTVGTHPAFVEMIRQLITERTQTGAERHFLGSEGTRPDTCALDCCGGSQRP